MPDEIFGGCRWILLLDAVPLFIMKVTLNNSTTLELGQDGSQTLVNGQPATFDLRELRPGSYHLLYNGKSFEVEVLQSDTLAKKHLITINGKKVEAVMRDRFDDLLKELGMDAAASLKVGDLKAPMPGLVVDIPVKEGDVVSKGDTLVILEAMKMENALKAVADATVKKIVVTKGQAVDKNTLLIQLG
jgi:biotin carboxyl carrier protein